MLSIGIKSDDLFGPMVQSKLDSSPQCSPLSSVDQVSKHKNSRSRRNSGRLIARAIIDDNDLELHCTKSTQNLRETSRFIKRRDDNPASHSGGLLHQHCKTLQFFVISPKNEDFMKTLLTSDGGPMAM
jgi:hypothetical protein